MPFSELLLSTTSTTDAANSVINVHDLQTLSSCGVFRQCSTIGKATTVIPASNDSDGAILSAQADKGLIHAYLWNREQVHLKSILPEKLSVLQASNLGTYVIGGTPQGRLYVWELSSGRLFRVFDAHYRRITRIVFSSDDAVVITASEDATIKTWLLTALVDLGTISTPPEPLSTISEHTLAISDLQVGIGTYSSARVFSSSMDSTIKVWQLATNTLLTTFVFQSSILVMAIDPLERHIYSGANDGIIYLVDLYSKRDNETGYDAIGGNGQMVPSTSKTFTGHKQPITSLALSLDTSILVSAASTDPIMIWDTASRQCIKTLSTKAPIVELIIISRPNEYKLESTSTNVSKRVIGRFQRIPVSSSSDIHLPKPSETQDPFIVISKSSQHNIPDFHTQIAAEISSFNTQIILPANSSNVEDTHDLQSRLEKLEQEHADLQTRYKSLKDVNDHLWENTVKQFLPISSSSKT